MAQISIPEIVSFFKSRHGLILSKLPHKKIFFENKSKSVVVAMPSSKVHERGNGWVDLTKIQLELFKTYSHGFIVFRLSNSTVYYVDIETLLPLLTQNSMHENAHEGKHWKLDIWSDKISVRKSDSVLLVKENDSSCVRKCL